VVELLGSLTDGVGFFVMVGDGNLAAVLFVLDLRVI